MEPAYADDSIRVFAPDGIEIVPLVMPGARYLAVVEGRIPPGEYPSHLHYSLEQVTYVLEGELTVGTWDAAAELTREVHLKAGAAIITLPTQSLSFSNRTTRVVRVLFITAPPYPADNSDTLILEGHRAPTPDERQRSAECHQQLIEGIRLIASARADQLRGESP